MIKHKYIQVKNGIRTCDKKADMDYMLDITEKTLYFL